MQMILADNFSLAGATRKPQLGRSIGQNLRGGMPVRLRLSRPTEAVLTGSAVFNPASLIDAAGETTTVAVTGAALGDSAEASFSLDTAGITITAWVSAANVVSVRFQNETGGTLDIASGTLSAKVYKANSASATVWGANIPNPWANRANTNAFRQRTDVTDANLVAADYQFLSDLDFVTFANYNWFALLDEFEELVTEIGTSLGGLITSGTGAKARLDFTSEAKTGDGATTVFDLLADFSLLTHCNLQVKVNSVIQATTAFTLTDNGSGKIRVTFTAAPGNTLAIAHQLYPKPGKSFGLAKATPVSLKAVTTAPLVVEEIISKDAMWLATGAGSTSPIHASVQALGIGA